MRHSALTLNALGVAALVAFLAGCSGGSSQMPALSGSANSTVAPNASHGFMQPTNAKTPLVYMSSWGTAFVVDVFTTKGLQVGQIANGLVEPQGIFVDAKGSLWVANASNVLVFPRGALSASTTLTDPVGFPVDVTVCPNGTAYVADLYDTDNSHHASIQVYAPGSTSPTGNLDYTNDFRNPFLTCDATGNVFATISTGPYAGTGRVIEFPHGKKAHPKDLGIVLQAPGGIKPDNAGNLLVSDLIDHTITEYAESGSPTGPIIVTGLPILGLAVSRDGRTVLGADPNNTDGITWSFPGGKQEQVYTCCSRIGPPIQNNYGVAFYPSQKGI